MRKYQKHNDFLLISTKYRFGSKIEEQSGGKERDICTMPVRQILQKQQDTLVHILQIAL